MIDKKHYFALSLALIYCIVATAGAAADPIRCQTGSHYSECGSACPARCRPRTARAALTCQALICPETPRCWCDSGYVLNRQNKCVKPSHC
ncbi:chymotrypsin-elastase inhibitor ixodidin-like [Trichogramma pretiosum]|uniref:chymotrypsin-elastase inhibitor ixodidin-like n=1 Tax=Trichogramma pretiosum TaxID=7493 RepID=UPI0006C9BABF|nr:chymotrypsin-elastase inhibitor ixodidin-like [Trichogramma pretiosum]